MRLITVPLAALCLLLTACKPTPVSDSAHSYATSEATASPDTEVSPFASASPEPVAVTAAAPKTCLEEKGQAGAEQLVQRCIAVSPATHPPCNVQNPCQMIQEEIDRACAMYKEGEKKPSECAG